MIVTRRYLRTRWLVLVAALPWPTLVVAAQKPLDGQEPEQPAAIAPSDVAALVALPSNSKPASKCERVGLEGTTWPQLVDTMVTEARPTSAYNKNVSQPLRGTHPSRAFLCRLLL
jgi:hypothetical protein